MSFVYQMPDTDLVTIICKGSLMSLVTYSHLVSSVFATAVVIICFMSEQTANSQ